MSLAPVPESDRDGKVFKVTSRHGKPLADPYGIGKTITDIGKAA